MAIRIRRLAIALFVLTPGCGEKAGNNPSKQGQPSPTKIVATPGPDGQEPNGLAQQPPQVAAQLAGPVEMTLTVDELGKEESKDRKGTHAKYKGKVIEVSGVVRGVNRSLFLTPLVSLTGEKD